MFIDKKKTEALEDNFESFQHLSYDDKEDSNFEKINRSIRMYKDVNKPRNEKSTKCKQLKKNVPKVQPKKAPGQDGI